MDRVARLITATAVIAMLIAVAAPQSRPAAAPVQGPAGLRVGVFDSRCVALAYYNSPEFQAERKQLLIDLEAARASKDQRRVDALMFEGPAVQNLLHYQVFSTASIPNVLERTTGALPKIAAEARVSMIVSKWDVAYGTPGVEVVDVTDAMVAVFKPSAELRQKIEAMKAQTPMGLMQAVKSVRPDR